MTLSLLPHRSLRLERASAVAYCHRTVGFYVRKSIKAGPFRFNLSKSGLGVSAGVPGFRVGTGPRGNYVHAGRGGLYYRATLGGSGAKRSGYRSPAQYSVPQFLPSTDVVLSDVTGASAEELHPTGPGDFVEQLNRAARQWRTAPLAAAFFIVLLLAKPIVGGPLLLLGIPLTLWLWLRDRGRRSVVAFYDVNDEVEKWFNELVGSFEALASCNRVWRINAAGQVTTTYQYKVNSGASKVVSRSDARVSFEPPALVKTNIKVPTFTTGRAALSFFPDRVLVRNGRTYSDVRYSDVEVAANPQRFIEDGRVPRDSQQVGTTWQYVNVKGGPDRRFKNNRQLPVMLYGRLEFASRGGLFWIFDLSRPEIGDRVAAVVSSAPPILNTVTGPPPEAEPVALPASSS